MYLDPRFSYFKSGACLMPNKPSARAVRDLKLDDVATSLENLCRYNGNRKVSVLRHTIAMVQIMRLMGLNLDKQRWAILHDVSEIITGEIARPMRQHAMKIKEIESEWDDLILSFHRADHVIPVKPIDQSMPIVEIMASSNYKTELSYSIADFPFVTPILKAGGLDVMKAALAMSEQTAIDVFKHNYNGLFKAPRKWS